MSLAHQKWSRYGAKTGLMVAANSGRPDLKSYHSQCSGCAKYAASTAVVLVWRFFKFTRSKLACSLKRCFSLTAASRTLRRRLYFCLITYCSTQPTSKCMCVHPAVHCSVRRCCQ